MKEKSTPNYEEFEEFDELEYIGNEEDAQIYLTVSAEDTGIEVTLERVDDAWDVVNRAAERHGFAITPAIVDAYAAARATAEAHAAGVRAFAGCANK